MIVVRWKCRSHSFIHAEVLNRLISYLHLWVAPFTGIFNDWAVLGWLLKVCSVWVLVDGLQLGTWDICRAWGRWWHFQYCLARSLRHLSRQLGSTTIFSQYSEVFGMVGASLVLFFGIDQSPLTKCAVSLTRTCVLLRLNCSHRWRILLDF
jgi:hypothetical protein